MDKKITYISAIALGILALAFAMPANPKASKLQLKDIRTDKVTVHPAGLHTDRTYFVEKVNLERCNFVEMVPALGKLELTGSLE